MVTYLLVICSMAESPGVAQLSEHTQSPMAKVFVPVLAAAEQPGGVVLTQQGLTSS